MATRPPGKGQNGRSRMRAALGIFVVLLIASIAWTAVATASSTSTRPVTIELLRNGAPGFEPTTWSSSGAFADSGTWTIDRFICGACPSPVTGAPHFDTTLVSDGGTIEIRIQAMFNLVQPNEVNLWEVVDGTGAYAKLHGNGTYQVQVVNDVRHIFLSGDVTGAP